MSDVIVQKTVKEFYDIMNESVNTNIDNIIPLFKKKNAICISTSDFYTKYASLLLLSIIDNASIKNEYDIIVLTTDMSFENEHIIKNLTDKKNIKIRVYNISEKVNSYKFYTWAHFTPNTYYRLSIPELLSNYDKVLYLDSDTIANDDVYKIFTTDMKGFCIAAAKDTHVLSYCNGLSLQQLEYNKNELKLKNPTNYYQMGVSLFDIKNIKKTYHKNLLETASKVKYRWLDQDVLNVEFQSKIKELPVYWNMMIANKPPFCDEYYLPDEYRKQYYKARLNPGILHYCGGVYYRYPFLPDMGHYFWKYALKSPFFEEIITQMMVLKMPQNDSQHKELEVLRHEFEYSHFPNINNQFKLTYVMNHLLKFRLKKLYYKCCKMFSFGNTYKKYSDKYKSAKQLINDAKKLRRFYGHI